MHMDPWSRGDAFTDGMKPSKKCEGNNGADHQNHSKP
jgi:hypothetical protein